MNWPLKLPSSVNLSSTLLICQQTWTLQTLTFLFVTLWCTNWFLKLLPFVQIDLKLKLLSSFSPYTTQYSNCTHNPFLYYTLQCTNRCLKFLPSVWIDLNLKLLLSFFLFSIQFNKHIHIILFSIILYNS